MSWLIISEIFPLGVRGQSSPLSPSISHLQQFQQRQLQLPQLQNLPLQLPQLAAVHQQLLLQQQQLQLVIIIALKVLHLLM